MTKEGYPVAITPLRHTPRFRPFFFTTGILPFALWAGFAVRAAPGAQWLLIFLGQQKEGNSAATADETRALSKAGLEDHTRTRAWIPAFAGMTALRTRARSRWVPAFAGMTIVEFLLAAADVPLFANV